MGDLGHTALLLALPPTPPPALLARRPGQPSRPVSVCAFTSAAYTPHCAHSPQAHSAFLPSISLLAKRPGPVREREQSGQCWEIDSERDDDVGNGDGDGDGDVLLMIA